MNNPEATPQREPASDSTAGIVGSGITIASIGVLFLLLGWAQHLREVPTAALILLIIGAVLFIGGGVLAMMGNSRKAR